MNIDDIPKNSELISDEKLINLIYNHFSDIKKTKWTNEMIETQLGNRTIQDIISSHETCYMGSCVDMTLSFIVKLQKEFKHLNLSLGCELLRHKKNGVYSIHFFIKDIDNKRIIDFTKNNEVSIYDGEYKNPGQNIKINQLSLHFLPGKEMTESDSLHTIVQKLGLPISKGYFQLYLNKLKSDNSDEEFEDFKSKRSKIKIFIDGKSSPYSHTQLAEAQNKILQQTLQYNKIPRPQD